MQQNNDMPCFSADRETDRFFLRTDTSIRLSLQFFSERHRLLAQKIRLDIAVRSEMLFRLPPVPSYPTFVLTSRLFSGIMKGNTEVLALSALRPAGKRTVVPGKEKRLCKFVKEPFPI